MRFHVVCLGALFAAASSSPVWADAQSQFLSSFAARLPIELAIQDGAPPGTSGRLLMATPNTVEGSLDAGGKKITTDVVFHPMDGAEARATLSLSAPDRPKTELECAGAAAAQQLDLTCWPSAVFDKRKSVPAMAQVRLLILPTGPNMIIQSGAGQLAYMSRGTVAALKAKAAPAAPAPVAPVKPAPPAAAKPAVPASLPSTQTRLRDFLRYAATKKIPGGKISENFSGSSKMADLNTGKVLDLNLNTVARVQHTDSNLGFIITRHVDSGGRAPRAENDAWAFTYTGGPTGMLTWKMEAPMDLTSKDNLCVGKEASYIIRIDCWPDYLVKAQKTAGFTPTITIGFQIETREMIVPYAEGNFFISELYLTD